jgi:hypothetical protein
MAKPVTDAMICRAKHPKVNCAPIVSTAAPLFVVRTGGADSQLLGEGPTRAVAWQNAARAVQRKAAA